MRPRAHYEQELNQLYYDLRVLGLAVVDAISAAVSAFERADLGAAQEIVANDVAIDRKREEIEQRVLVLIALQQPVAGDLRLLLAALEIASELERIGDYAKRIGKATLRNPLPPVSPPSTPIKNMGEIAVKMLTDGFSAFVNRDVSVLDSLLELDDELDRMEDEVRAQMLGFIQREPAAAEWAVDRTLVAHTIERVGDRVTNVAEQLVFAIKGERVDLNP